MSFGKLGAQNQQKTTTESKRILEWLLIFCLYFTDPHLWLFFFFFPERRLVNSKKIGGYLRKWASQTRDAY